MRGRWIAGLCSLAALGCDTREETTFTPSPAVTYPDRGSDASIQAPDRPRIDVNPAQLRFLPGDTALDLRVRSTGAQALGIEAVRFTTEAEGWALRIGEADPVAAPEVLADPDGDGEPGVGPASRFTVTVVRVDTAAGDVELEITSTDPQTPRVGVAVLGGAGLDGGGEADLGVDGGAADAGPDAEPDAAWGTECTVAEDCAVAVDLTTCDPCPVAATAEAVSASRCLVDYEWEGFLLAYEPVDCTFGCSPDAPARCQQFPQPFPACEVGLCVLAR